MSTVNNGPQIVKSGMVLDLDASYMRSYSPNVHPNPTNIFAWSGTGNNNCTLTADTTITRQYGSIPLKMVMTGTDPYTGTYNVSTWNLAPAANGQTWTLSFYAKGSETLTGNCYIFGANSSGNYIEAFATSFTVTNSWQRFSLTSTFSNASTVYIQIRFGGASGQVGKTIWWDGVQVERASSATPFNPYYFGNTVWKDVSTANKTSALVNGPTFDSTNKGTIYYDGVANYCQITPAADFEWTPSGSGLNNMTIDLWIKTSDGAGTILSKPWNASGEYNYSLSYYQFFVVIGNQSANFSFTSIATGNWVNLVILVSSTQWGAYINGTQNVALTNHNITNNTPTYGNAGTPLALMTLYPYGSGWAGNTGFSVQGNVGSFRIYNRVLSATEISQNYQSDKTKFGL